VAAILIMEDAEPLRRILTYALREDGHDVTDSSDGTICYDRDVVSKTEVMIADIDMPKVNGIEAILTAQKIKPNLKIIAMSGGGTSDNDDYLNICSDFGVASTLQKPFDPEVLIQTIRTLLPS